MSRSLMIFKMFAVGSLYQTTVFCFQKGQGGAGDAKVKK